MALLRPTVCPISQVPDTVMRREVKEDERKGADDDDDDERE